MRRGSAPPGDSATRITGIALGLIFFAPRRGIVCLWTDISYIWHPDATLIKQNARGTAGDNRVKCNRIPRAAVYVIPPAPPGDSAGQKIALIATGLYLPKRHHKGCPEWVWSFWWPHLPMPHWRDCFNHHICQCHTEETFDCHIWQCHTQGIVLIATFDNATLKRLFWLSHLTMPHCEPRVAMMPTLL